MLLKMISLLIDKMQSLGYTFFCYLLYAFIEIDGPRHPHSLHTEQKCYPTFTVITVQY